MRELTKLADAAAAAIRAGQLERALWLLWLLRCELAAAGGVP